MDHRLVQINETMSHALQDHLRWMGLSVEFWQNVVNWWRELEITPVFFPQEPHEHYEKAKVMTVEDEVPWLVGVQYATGEGQDSTSRKNEEAEPKRKWCSGVVLSHGESKVWCYIEQ